MSCLSRFKICPQLFEIFLELGQGVRHGFLFSRLLRHDLCVSLLLLLRFLDNFSVLQLGSMESLVSIISKLFDQLQPLDCLSFDFTVVILHDLQIRTQSVELCVQQIFQVSDVLTLVIVSVKNARDFFYLKKFDWWSSLN